MNPAYDITYTVDAVTLGSVHRVSKVAVRAGGKGVNVARVLGQLGRESVALGLADAAFTRDLTDSGISADFVMALSHVRRTVVITEPDTRTTSLWEPGPRLAVDDAGIQLRQRVRARLPQARGLVVAGSLPPGIDPALPAELAEIAIAAGIPVICDVDDDALRAAASVAGTVLMPNRDELSRLIGTPVADTATAVADAAKSLVAAGPRAVVATRGERGLVAVDADGAWAAALPQPVRGNPTGAGDAATAAVIAALADHQDRIDWATVLADVVAASAAAVTVATAGGIDAAARDALRPLVTVTPVEPSCP
ncbi:MAG: hexose kinase [Mycobacteriaceae bacterium]|nr:hexose kinase [Mycobacteriaceae bacterium]